MQGQAFFFITIMFGLEWQTWAGLRSVHATSKIRFNAVWTWQVGMWAWKLTQRFCHSPSQIDCSLFTGSISGSLKGSWIWFKGALMHAFSYFSMPVPWYADWVSKPRRDKSSPPPGSEDAPQPYADHNGCFESLAIPPCWPYTQDPRLCSDSESPRSSAC